MNTLKLLKGNAVGTALVIGLYVLTACSAAEPRQKRDHTSLEVAGIRIANDLAIDVTDVRILVPATGDFVSCGNILARTSCSTSFPGRAYRGNPVQVSWKENGEPNSTPEFRLEAPSNLGEANSAWIEVVIFLPGQAGAHFVTGED